MPTVNDTLHDAMVGHQVDLEQYATGVVRRLIALLNRSDSDLFQQITAALERLDASSFTVERLEFLLASVRSLNAGLYFNLEQQLSGEMRQLAEYESGYQFDLFSKVLPERVVVQIGLAPVTAESVYAAALARPFQGRLLREFARDIGEARMVRIRDAIRIGYVEGATTAQIAQRIRGTRAKGYADGIIEIDRRHAMSVVRTALSHTAAVARERFHGANLDLIKALSWSATLDSRVSEICRPRDQKQYTPDTHKPIGHKMPWLGGPGVAHFGCRSCSVPVTKSFRELGIPLDELPPGERASMDGAVPATTDFNSWLSRQSAKRQDEVLGATRGRLYRQGGLPMDRFYSDKGIFLSLEDLRKRDAAAFGKAGL